MNPMEACALLCEHLERLVCAWIELGVTDGVWGEECTEKRLVWVCCRAIQIRSGEHCHDYTEL